MNEVRITKDWLLSLKEECRENLLKEGRYAEWENANNNIGKMIDIIEMGYKPETIGLMCPKCGDVFEVSLSGVVKV